MNKALMTVVAVVIVAAAGGWYFWSHPMNYFGGTPAASTNASDPVATVNGTPITRGQLTTAETQIAAQNPNATSTAAQVQIQSSALDSLIGRELLLQAAAKAGVTASSTQVEAQLAAAKAQFPTQDAYQQALTAQGLTEDALRAQISGDLTLQAFLGAQLNLSSATTTEAEIRAAYAQASSTQANMPPLAQVHDQIAQYLVQQKQQAAVAAYVQQLRATADIKILIATSTTSA